MSGDRSERALARIEAALARIEAAASNARSGDNDGEVEQLRARHAKLRSAVTESLAQLDAMLEGPRG
jgi:hypothetical protein